MTAEDEVSKEFPAEHCAHVECCSLDHLRPLAEVDNPYDDDGYCCWCGNGKWKFHAPWCKWADAHDGPTR